MRSALRAATVGTVAIGMFVSSIAVGSVGVTSASAAEPKESTARTSLVSVPYVGGSCTVGVRLTTASGQIGNQWVAVQYRLKGNKRWNNFKTVKTKKVGTVKVKRTSTRAVQFRTVFLGTWNTAPDNSNVVTCTPKTLSYGVSSAGVKKVQKKLKALRVRPASTSGRFDYNTLQATYAYQKSRILPRTGTINGKLYDTIMKTKKMVPSKWCKDADTICVDISKQAAYLKVKGKTYTIPVSSGGNYYYYDPQSKTRDFARTPRGSFSVYYKKPGLSKGPLGTYYWMSFFTGGYGVHGSASVPTQPASHGCVRVPRTIEQWVYKNLPVGAKVRVHD